MTFPHCDKEDRLIKPEMGQSQAMSLRVDFFPTPPKQPASRRTTRLTMHKVAETANTVERTTRYFVQCNCACK